MTFPLMMGPAPCRPRSLFLLLRVARLCLLLSDN